MALAVAELPETGVALSEFAARVLGDAHALDDDRPASGLVLGAALAMSGEPEGSGAAWRRRVWASVGVLKDELSSTVLALTLPGDDSTATGRALAALGEAGQPAVLTPRQLVRDRPRPDWSEVVVSVCENPAVLAAVADRLGADTRPREPRSPAGRSRPGGTRPWPGRWKSTGAGSRRRPSSRS